MADVAVDGAVHAAEAPPATAAGEVVSGLINAASPTPFVPPPLTTEEIFNPTPPPIFGIADPAKRSMVLVALTILVLFGVPWAIRRWLLPALDRRRMAAQQREIERQATDKAVLEAERKRMIEAKAAAFNEKSAELARRKQAERAAEADRKLKELRKGMESHYATDDIRDIMRRDVPSLNARRANAIDGFDAVQRVLSAEEAQRMAEAEAAAAAALEREEAERESRRAALEGRIGGGAGVPAVPAPLARPTQPAPAPAPVAKPAAPAPAPVPAAAAQPAKEMKAPSAASAQSSSSSSASVSASSAAAAAAASSAAAAAAAAESRPKKRALVEEELAEARKEVAALRCTSEPGAGEANPFYALLGSPTASSSAGAGAGEGSASPSASSNSTKAPVSVYTVVVTSNDWRGSFRVSRRFRCTDTVRSLMDWVTSVVPGGMAGRQLCTVHPRRIIASWRDYDLRDYKFDSEFEKLKERIAIAKSIEGDDDVTALWTPPPNPSGVTELKTLGEMGLDARCALVLRPIEADAVHST